MKSYIIFIIVAIIIILGIIIVPKYLGEGDKKVKFEVLDTNEVPREIIDILPKYLAEERALSCKIEEGVFVVVTRGEKSTGGYSVEIDNIEKIKNEDGKCDLVVYAKFNDPKPDEIVQQVITYPFTIAKTNLKTIPDNIKLEVKKEEKSEE